MLGKTSLAQLLLIITGCDWLKLHHKFLPPSATDEILGMPLSVTWLNPWLSIQRQLAAYTQGVLSPVYTVQPVAKRFDNRLYRVNGVLVFSCQRSWWNSDGMILSGSNKCTWGRKNY